jgi:hypothetical protein
MKEDKIPVASGQISRTNIAWPPVPCGGHKCVASGCRQRGQKYRGQQSYLLVATHILSSLSCCPSARRFDAALVPPSPPARLATTAVPSTGIVIPLLAIPAEATLIRKCPTFGCRRFPRVPITEFFRGLRSRPARPALGGRGGAGRAGGDLRAGEKKFGEARAVRRR